MNLLEKIFKFGGGEKRVSQSALTIPATLAGKSVLINTDVVDSDIPLLLSKDAMKEVKVKLDLVNDTAEILGVEVSLNLTSSGHYCLPIDATSTVPIESVCAVNIGKLNNKDKHKALQKLHRQFAHPSEAKMKTLLMDANVWDDDLKDVLSVIYEQCEMCKIYRKTPARPVVCLPIWLYKL